MSGAVILSLWVATASAAAGADFDKDGIADLVDDCPTDPGNATNQGCPGEAPAPTAVAPAAPTKPVKLGTNNTLQLPDPVQFKSGSSTLQPASRAVLQQVAATITTSLGDRSIRIEGHTDNRGGAASNQRLSQARAEAVLAVLVRYGVKRENLSAVGFGEERPQVSNRTPAGRRTNRRVELHVAPLAKSQ